VHSLPFVLRKTKRLGTLPLLSDGVKARAPKTKAIGIKAKAIVHKAKAKAHKAKEKVINRDQGLRQGHDEPTQYHFLWRKYLPVTNSVY